MKAVAVVLGAVLLCIATAAGAFAAWASGRVGGPDERDYVERNDRVLASLPVPPGASVSRSFSRVQHNRPGWPYGIGPPTGWTTTRVYEAARAWAEVRSFYLARLVPAWSFSWGDESVTFSRERTEVHIARTPSGFLIAVDRDCQVLCAGGRKRPAESNLVVELRPNASQLSGVAIIDSTHGSPIDVVLAPRIDGVKVHLHEGPCARRHTRPVYVVGETANGELLGSVPTDLSLLGPHTYSIDVHAPGATARAACGTVP